MAHWVVPGHAEAAGDNVDAQVPGEAAVAALVQHGQGHEQNAGGWVGPWAIVQSEVSIWHGRRKVEIELDLSFSPCFIAEACSESRKREQERGRRGRVRRP